MNYSFYSRENWESDIREVTIESCDADPLGFMAVFTLSEASAKNGISFKIGASTLAQRAKSLSLAGYSAPMTKKAIAMLESRMAGPGCSACA
ncbi:MAG: hypothetical protein DYH13_05165 [Alphaproteobacteria bacterium PRO2]|nr:hypothetical protein [Alphaproteobacteria bacterium PRO2]